MVILTASKSKPSRRRQSIACNRHWFSLWHRHFVTSSLAGSTTTTNCNVAPRLGRVHGGQLHGWYDVDMSRFSARQNQYYTPDSRWNEKRSFQGSASNLFIVSYIRLDIKALRSLLYFGTTKPSCWRRERGSVVTASGGAVFLSVEERAAVGRLVVAMAGLTFRVDVTGGGDALGRGVVEPG